jgi:hypothetical protein
MRVLPAVQSNATAAAVAAAKNDLTFIREFLE